MTGGKTDWKVQAILDRDQLEEDIGALVEILKRQRVSCIVDADSEETARMAASHHMKVHMGIPPRYVRALHPRRLPT